MQGCFSSLQPCRSLPGKGKPKTGSRERLHEWSNSRVGYCLHLTDLETTPGSCLRFTVALLYLGLAMGILIVWYCIGQRLHVLFWLGVWPQIALFATMLALAASFLLMMRIRIIRFFRFQQLRDGIGRAGRHDTAKRTQIGRLRPMVVVSAALAMIAVVFGLVTIKEGLGISAALLHDCSGSAAVANISAAVAFSGSAEVQKLQAISERLVEFQKLCHASDGQDKTLVSDCPGFRKKFTNQSSHVAYLVRLEDYEGCSGFCTPSDPIAFKGREQAIVGKLACAEVVGQHVRLATLIVSLPSIVIGLALVILAWLLFEYDHL